MCQKVTPLKLTPLKPMPLKFTIPAFVGSSLASALALAVMPLTTISQPALAQTCERLDVVGGDGTEITKTVSPPDLLFFNNNWNTDFAMNSGRSYSYFVIDFISESGTSYNIDIFLKYPDDSVDRSYSVKQRPVTEGEAIAIRAEARSSSDPYQVNLRVGGLNSEGNTYTASVSGCR